MKELLLDVGVRMGYVERGRTISVSFVRTSYLNIGNAARAHEAGTVLRYSHQGPCVVPGRGEEPAA